VLAEALVAVHKNAEHYYEAELYRIRGELLWQEGREESLEETGENFLQALDIARHQGAKSLELRVVMSLSHLWRHQGRRKEARRMLGEVYGWFTEGFDTVDLQEAKALLADLA